MKIGAFSLPNNVIWAPIAGFSDIGARALQASFGAGLTYTEMVSAKGLYYKNKNTAELLTTSEYEKIKACQLFGSEPDIFAEVLSYPVLKDFDIIDINMGCPVPKVVKNGEGSALLLRPELIRDIVAATVKAAGKRAVTVKMRAGFSKGSTECVEAAIAAEEGGAAAVTVHGRRREDYYSGTVDYIPIRLVKEALHIPVIGNGDVTDKSSYDRMIAETGVDGVMIARGAIGRPYIFSELAGIPYSFDIKKAVAFQMEVSCRVFPEESVAANMRKQVHYFIKGHPNAKAIKLAVYQAKSPKDILEILDRYL